MNSVLPLRPPSSSLPSAGENEREVIVRAAGSIVTILVRGDTGLDNDPGEFSAIAVVIAD